jgi:hypothetical protein
MRTRWWILIALSTGVASALLAGFATDQARPTLSAWATGLNAGLLAATLVAILWYSLRTHRLVDLQRDVAAVGNHPWLSAMYLTPRELPPDEKAPFGSHEAMLPIVNTGRTPARLRRVTVTVEVEKGSDPDADLIPGGDDNPRVLVPGDRVDVKVLEIIYGGPPPTVYLDIVIEYDSIDDGSGRLTLQFRFANGRWKNRASRYDFTLPAVAHRQRRP